jgi:hypothetical protein
MCDKILSYHAFFRSPSISMAYHYISNLRSGTSYKWQVTVMVTHFCRTYNPTTNRDLSIITDERVSYSWTVPPVLFKKSCANDDTNLKGCFILIFNYFVLQGCLIHAKILYHLMRTFGNRLDEGRMYTLQRFAVMSYSMSYRPLRRDIFILFNRGTSITPSTVQPSLFARYVFELIPFHDLALRVNDATHLTGSLAV